MILAFDVSGSMAATDYAPTRMEAAKAAAKAFVQRQPASVVIGVVAFSDSGVAVQQPTNDQAPSWPRSTGSRPRRHVRGSRDPRLAHRDRRRRRRAQTWTTTPTASPSPTLARPVPAGTHVPAVVVLLSDGENNEAPDPLAAAQTAADQGVRIFTVGIGSPAGANLDLDGFQVHTQLDASTLQQVADTTGGTYYGADDAGTLKSIYDHLDTALVVRPEEIELTAVVAGAGLLLLLAAGLASLAWLGRVP